MANGSERIPIYTYVPGKGATEYFAALSDESPTHSHFYHEELAYTVAHGASLSGSPGFVFVKSHGIAKAMNSVVASLYSGCGAPLLIFTFEDYAGVSSDHPFASKEMLTSIGANVISADLTDLYQKTRFSFELALEIRKPIFLSLDAAKTPDTSLFASIKSLISTLIQSHQNKFRPAARHQALLNPLLSPRFFHRIETLPECPRDLPPVLKATAESYEPYFDVMTQESYDWITGDAGTSSLFGLPPKNLINVCTHMGGAIPLAIGASLSGAGRTLAVSGDFSVVSTANLALTEALRRRARMDLVIFRNGLAAATGGQIVEQADLMRQLPDGVKVFEVDQPQRLKQALSENPPTSVRAVVVNLYENH